MAIVVASLRLIQVSCRTPRQMSLVNALRHAWDGLLRVSLQRRQGPVTVITIRFGSAAICAGQNLSGSHCLRLNSLVWSA